MPKKQLLDLVYALYNRYSAIVYDNIYDVVDYESDEINYAHVAIAAMNTYHMLKYVIIYILIKEGKVFSEKSSLLELANLYKEGNDIYDDRILSIAQIVSDWGTECSVMLAQLQIDRTVVEQCAETISSIWFRTVEEDTEEG